MLIKVMEDVRDLGFEAALKRTSRLDADHTLLTLKKGSEVWPFSIATRGRAPFPVELPALEPLKAKLSVKGPPTLSAPYISEDLGKELSKRGWSWLDELGNYDFRQGPLILRRRVPGSPPPSPMKGLFRAGASLTIARWLMTRAPLNKPLRQADLAKISGISQPRVSQIISAFLDQGLLISKGRRAYLTDRETLLDAFLMEYQGPGGSTQYGYSLDSPLSIATEVSKWARETFGDDHEILISGDVAADLLSPWRDPTHLVVYANSPLPFEELDVGETVGAGDSNIIWHIPEDDSVFSIARAASTTVKFKTNTFKITDIPQILWDLKHLSGSERLAGLERMRDWHRNRCKS